MIRYQGRGGRTTPKDFPEGGFTLIELMVVVLIIGILTAFAVPRYLKAVESTKADDAIALAKMVAAANRMYALDHAGRYASGTLDNLMNDDACAGTANPAPAGDLIGCGYLQGLDWDSKGYTVAAANGHATSGTTTCLGITAPGGLKAAGCTKRKTSGLAGTNISPYNGWGYVVSVSGVLGTTGSAPVPVGL